MLNHIKRSKRICTYSLTFFATLLALVIIVPIPGLFTFKNHYAALHTTLEFLGIGCCFAIFTIGWTTYRHNHSTNVLLLSVSSLAVGLLDLGHTLSYQGMPVFVTASGANKSIYFWIVSRLTDACALLIVAISLNYRTKGRAFSRLGLLAAILWTGLWFAIILGFSDMLPLMYAAGKGLTGTKIFLEIIGLILSLVAGLIFFSKARGRETLSFTWLGTASLLFAMSSLFFTLYRDVDDLYNFLGHVYKAVAFCYIYRAILAECITIPYVEAQKNAAKERGASDSKTRFLANIGHELRTPLGVITGFSDILSMSKKLDPESLEWIGTIKNSAEQIRLLINDLLDLSKAESNSLSIVKERVLLAPVIEEVIEGLRVLAEQRGLKLFATFDSNAPKGLETDPLRFKQVLVNLISNSIKFTNEGEVEVHIGAVKQGEVIIKVRDTGVGIPEDKRHLLFKSYSQIEHTSVRPASGTGLGLVLSQTLASLLGGSLTLETSTPGVGSTFAFKVAADHDFKAVTADEVKQSTKKSAPHFGGVHIVLVDDAKENLFIAEQYLLKTGAKVTTFENPLEAIEFVAKHSEVVDVVFMDIKMPEMDGHEACKKMRELGHSKPIIALSAHSDLDESKESNENSDSHFSGHVMKPISRETLWESITMAILNN